MYIYKYIHRRSIYSYIFVYVRNTYAVVEYSEYIYIYICLQHMQQVIKRKINKLNWRVVLCRSMYNILC